MVKFDWQHLRIFKITYEFLLYLMLPGATYCHWNLHITRYERYKKKNV
jgi:hypothetical protein